VLVNVGTITSGGRIIVSIFDLILRVEEASELLDFESLDRFTSIFLWIGDLGSLVENVR